MWNDSGPASLRYGGGGAKRSPGVYGFLGLASPL